MNAFRHGLFEEQQVYMVIIYYSLKRLYFEFYFRTLKQKLV